MADSSTDIVFCFPRYKAERSKSPYGILSPAIYYQKLYQVSELQLGQRTSSKLNSGMHHLPQDAVKGFVAAKQGNKSHVLVNPEPDIHREAESFSLARIHNIAEQKVTWL